MPLNIYNTLTRRREEFKPLHKNAVGVYVCGPTVYSHSHIGHAKSYVSFDVAVRYFRYIGYNVLYVQNITDVGHLTDDADEGEDKLGKQAKIERIHPMQLAETYTRSYFEDMDALGVVRPDISPRATGHIIEQIEMVKQLIQKRFAYKVNGSVYFNVRKFKKYGKLSGRSLDQMMEGTRVKVRSEKKHPADFALWKKAEPRHIMRWPSPWGEGFPGWHIECSAMSMKYLGETFDIHGGGIDNQFPHHECEIAQSVCATGRPFVKYWMHNNLVTVNGQKMSKSLDNFVLLKDAFKKYDPLVVRFFILQSHYRNTLDFSDQALQAAKGGFERMNNTIDKLKQQIEFSTRTSSFGMFDRTQELESLYNQFIAAMDDDFNTPKAIAILFELVTMVNDWLMPGQLPNETSLQKVVTTFKEMGGTILGIIPYHRESGAMANGKLETDLMQLILDLRSEVRAQKLWALSDKIRDRLHHLGITLEDKKEGTTWRRS